MDIQKTTVVGGGLMGRQIALNASIYGVDATVYDLKGEVCDAVEAWKEEYLAGRIAKGRMTEEKVAEIAAQIKENKAELVVVGLPKNMDGTEGESARRARELAEKISQLSGVPFHMQDERGTTITAHAYLSAKEVYGKKRKKQVDAVAASIILQDYLDSQKG